MDYNHLLHIIKKKFSEFLKPSLVFRRNSFLWGYKRNKKKSSLKREVNENLPLKSLRGVPTKNDP